MASGPLTSLPWIPASILLLVWHQIGIGIQWLLPRHRATRLSILHWEGLHRLAALLAGIGEWFVCLRVRKGTGGLGRLCLIVIRKGTDGISDSQNDENEKIVVQVDLHVGWKQMEISLLNNLSMGP